MKRQRLYINIDHIATIRQARRGDEPDPVEAAVVCERAGADGITTHPRKDGRHIQDDDIQHLATTVTTVLHLDMACTDEMIAIAEPRLNATGGRTPLFIGRDVDVIDRSKEIGVATIVLHTGQYAHAPADPRTIVASEQAAAHGASIGLPIHAGQGLTAKNVGPVACIPEIEELNIGQSVVSRAVFVGLETAVRERRVAMDAVRAHS